MSDLDRQPIELKQEKIVNLELRLSFLQQERKEILHILNTVQDAVDSVKLRRQLRNVEEYIELVSADLDQLRRETLEQFEQLNQGDDNLMSKLDVLRELNLGRIVAEQDDLLETCFIPTVALREVVSEKVDLVLGTKGSGKSAIWVELQKNHQKYLTDKNLYLLPATNPTGDLEFRDVLAAIDQNNYPSEDDLRLAWRLYLLGQIWKEIKKCDLEKVQGYSSLEKSLKKYGLVYENSNLKTTFAFAITKARSLKRLDIKWKEGIQFEFDQSELQSSFTFVSVPFNELLSQIDDFLKQNNKFIWIVLDRLDEIVINNIDLENLTLKGLLLAYRDLSDLNNIKIKIFLRDDIYDRVTTMGQFPALTHIRSRATRPIKWSLEDLLNLVVTRLVQNKKIREVINLERPFIEAKRRREILYKIFPSRIDRGKAAEGFKWIVDRITDGKNVATPRDLLSVFERARTIQLEKIERDGVAPSEDLLFDEDSIRLAVKDVAKENLETRIFAEYPDLRKPITLFKGNKADHNDDTLREVLGDHYSKELITRLESIGFIYRRERKGYQVWTIPFFYSFALDVKRGAAFDMGEDDDDE